MSKVNLEDLISGERYSFTTKYDEPEVKIEGTFDKVIKPLDPRQLTQYIFTDGVKYSPDPNNPNNMIIQTLGTGIANFAGEDNYPQNIHKLNNSFSSKSRKNRKSRKSRKNNKSNRRNRKSRK